MIDRLRLSHFQCHEKLDLKLDQVTVLVGATDQGKSAVIRALRWLLTNKPLGDAFIQHGSDSVTVKARIDGHTIIRSKGDENLYRLDREKFVAFGNDVPDTIRDLLCVDDLNFQGQHDAAFWFSMPAGDVAKQLNAIVDLSEIDRVSSELNRIQRQAKTELSVANDRLQEVEEEASGLEYVEELHEALVELETMEAKLHLYSTRLESLSVVVQHASAYLDEKKRLIEWLSDAEKITRLGFALSDSIAAVNAMSHCIDQLESHQVTRKIPDTIELDRLYVESRYVENQLDALVPIVKGACTSLKRGIRRHRASITDYQQQLKEAFGDLCPVCGKAIG